MINSIRWFLASMKREKGATAIEYALMVALIAIAIIGTVYLLGLELDTIFNTIKEALSGTPPQI